MPSLTSAEGGGASPPSPGGDPPGGIWATKKSELAEEARAVGFAGMGVMRPEGVPELSARLEAFVAEGRHGQMGWMAERMG